MNCWLESLISRDAYSVFWLHDNESTAVQVSNERVKWSSEAVSEWAEHRRYLPGEIPQRRRDALLQHTLRRTTTHARDTRHAYAHELNNTDKWATNYCTYYCTPFTTQLSASTIISYILVQMWMFVRVSENNCEKICSPAADSAASPIAPHSLEVNAGGQISANCERYAMLTHRRISSSQHINRKSGGERTRR